MTFFSICNCEPPLTTCSLQEAIKEILLAHPSMQGVEVYTGGLATQADTGNMGPPLPHLILSDLGPVNERRVGESVLQHEILIRFQWYTVTEDQGRSLWRAAAAIMREAGSLGTVDGWACMGPVTSMPRSLKVGAEKWGTQANQTFFVHVTG